MLPFSFTSSASSSAQSSSSPSSSSLPRRSSSASPTASSSKCSLPFTQSPFRSAASSAASLHLFLPLFLLPLLLPPIGALLPRSSCRAHLLNGEAHTSEAVLPIRSPSGNIFWLLCRFPPALSSQSARLSVQTVVHNALEGQWLEMSPEGTIAGRIGAQYKSIGIEHQVNEWQFLRSLNIQSDDCQQSLRIRWPPIGNASRDEMFSVETFTGNLITIRRNHTKPAGAFEERMPLLSPPLIRLHPPMLRGIALSLEPLICRQMVIPRPECHFELRTDSDKVRLRLDALRKKWPRGILSVAFRTGKPNERLLELGSDEGVKTGVDLIDGYLLLANHIVHPVRLLADGAWHSLNLDLHSLSLRVDGQGTAISLVGGGSPVPSFRWMDILLVGEVAAVRVESAELEADEGHWICQTENGNAQDENEFINVHLNSAHHKHIFGLSPVCENERNFCNCKGRQPIAECAPSVASENAFHLSRAADRLAFFIVPNFGPRVPISVLLQSEEATGLVLFGVYTLATPSFGELGGRVQVHFVADTVFGSFCSTNTDGTERCLSCAIRRPRAFPSPDWVRFSLFHQQNLQFLAVDRQICVLSPNTDAVEAAELYKMTESNVLFVGGTFYAKGGARLGQRVSDSFRRQFQDNTREKAPSLQGCVAEIVVKGQPQNMDSLLLAQQQRATRHGKDGEEIFAMRKGCAECPTECRGAPCARIGGHNSQPECQCGEIYATTLGGSAANRRGGCVWADGTAQSAVGGGGIRLTTGGSSPSFEHDHELERPLSVPIRDPSAPRSRRRLRLNKVWTLLRMPETNAQLNTFVRIGGVQIAVGDNGRRLVVEAPEFAVREEFALHQPSDARLHLLSLEVTPSVGTAYAASSVTIRLNNERRRVVGLSEIPLAIGGQHQQQAVELRESVEIVPLIVPEGNNNDAPGVEGGCVTALVFHYVPLDEGLLSNDQMSSSIHHHQVDYVPLLHVYLHNGTGTRPSLPVDRLNLQRCGVVDATLWEGNSTSWGRTLEMDTSDAFFSGGIALFGRNAKWTRLSLLITTMLIIVILISLLLYGIVAAKRRHRQCEGLYNSKRSRCTNARIERVKLVVEEKRPLRTLKDGPDDDDEEEEKNNKSDYAIGTMAIPSSHKQLPKSCMRNGGGKYVNGVDRQRQNVAAERHILQFDDASLKMGIEQLDGSPKHKPAANDGFVATPLQAVQSTRRMMTPTATASQQQVQPPANPNERNSSGTNLPGTANASHNARELIRQKAPVRALPNGHSPLPASGNNGHPQTQRQRQQSPNAPIAPKDEL
uniref:Laminin G domain-containing protein n=1 Tax=Globodera rostochiensis TaxID=31243 RepID=A0A914HUT7_GLORO